MLQMIIRTLFSSLGINDTSVALLKTTEVFFFPTKAIKAQFYAFKWSNLCASCVNAVQSGH